MTRRSPMSDVFPYSSAVMATARNEKGEVLGVEITLLVCEPDFHLLPPDWKKAAEAQLKHNGKAAEAQLKHDRENEEPA